ncbi:hypothetical protein F3Y22_tig00111071pilonHSYRG00003 [Hibiscus syriacus]|uniref:Peptidase S8/S53 domain-containing protein n=1 Tax=Hibiscus syriacus TaxID=106335 RepID=A0A6A2Z2P8_HIBSY|nr:hypothetical protein F3Y22_tig00111071pilonHSYRG00003 [Hibiscus syriacus]
MVTSVVVIRDQRCDTRTEDHNTYIVQIDYSRKPPSFSTDELWHRSTPRSFARLTSSQLSEIEKSPANLPTYQESFGKLFTTHSPNFLGLKPFSPPACNNKLIGARSFSKGIRAVVGNILSELDYDSPRDFEGHGTHTSSAAIDSGNSAASDVLAGMDQAITDAVEERIVFVCAAGNDGSRNTTYNGAPWIRTVGAGTLDRGFTAKVTLADTNKAIRSMRALYSKEIAGKVVVCINSESATVKLMFPVKSRSLTDSSNKQGTKLGYNEAQMRADLRRSRWDCNQERNELNYPSFISISSKDERFPAVKELHQGGD